MKAAPFLFVPGHLPFAALAIVALLSTGVGASGASAASPVDSARRHESLAPPRAVSPSTQVPAVIGAVPGKRVVRPVFEKWSSSVETREAVLEGPAARPESLREKVTASVDVRGQPVRSPSRQRIGIASISHAVKLPAVSRYQDSLVAARPASMARFPAGEGATSVNFNRFGFRRNPSERVKAYPVVRAAVPRR